MSSETVRHVRLAANGIEFHVALAGRDDAPLLLCLHGFPECWFSWRHQLAQLSDRFLVAAPDLRGYGGTEKPARGYDIRTLARDAAALVGALGRPQAFLVGHDWGGMIACAAAGWHPEVFPRLVVLNAPHPAAIRRALASPRQLITSWYVSAIQVPYLADWLLSRHGAAFVRRLYVAGAHRPDAFTPETVRTLRENFARSGVVPAALAYYRVNLSPPAILRGRMNTPPVRIPTHVLFGRDDPFVDPVLFRRAERLFQGPYSFQVVADCGHWTQQEAPEIVNEALARFCR